MTAADIPLSHPQRAVMWPMARMYEVVTDVSLPVASAQTLLDAGWTADKIRVVRNIARITHTLDTVANRTFGDTSRGVPYGYIAQRLIAQGTAWAQDDAAAGLPVDDTLLEWLAVWAATTDPVQFTALEETRVRRRWLQQVGGSLTYLAWLAGLTIDEAQDQVAAGGLDEAALLSLAVLQGYPVGAFFDMPASVGTHG
jgi:hypothetical protein